MVANEGVIKKQDSLRNTGTLKILLSFLTAHHANTSEGVVHNKITLDMEDPVGERLIIDKLDAVFPVARDHVVPNNDRQLGAGIVMETNFDAVITVIDDLVGFNHRR